MLSLSNYLHQRSLFLQVFLFLSVCLSAALRKKILTYFDEHCKYLYINVENLTPDFCVYKALWRASCHFASAESVICLYLLVFLSMPSFLVHLYLLHVASIYLSNVFFCYNVNNNLQVFICI